jgi:hypothetical protein
MRTFVNMVMNVGVTLNMDLPTTSKSSDMEGQIKIPLTSHRMDPPALETIKI